MISTFENSNFATKMGINLLSKANISKNDESNYAPIDFFYKSASLTLRIYYIKRI
jgi:hypothetical protein